MRRTLSADAAFLERLPSPRPGPHRTAVVRVDDIGDYVVFRQSLAGVRAHPRLAGTELWLVGNGAWRDLAEAWDARVFDRFHWLDKGRFLGDRLHREQVLAELRGLGFHAVLCPSFTRNPVLEDALVRAIAAPENAGWRAPLSSLAPGVLAGSMALYQLPIEPRPSAAHERARGLEFWEALFRSPPWSVPGSPVPGYFPAPERPAVDGARVVLAPGAGGRSRRWAPRSFAALAGLIAAGRDARTEFVIVGGDGDRVLAGEIMAANAALGWRDMTGRTTLVELAGVVAGASLVVSGDTGAANIAAWQGTPLLVLHCGSNWGRFFPCESGRSVTLATPAFRRILARKGPQACHGWRGSTGIDEISPAMAYEALREGGLLR